MRIECMRYYLLYLRRRSDANRRLYRPSTKNTLLMKATKKPLRRRSLNAVIPLVIYPFDLMVSLGQTDEQLKASLKKYGIKWQDSLTLDCPAHYVRLERNQPVIRMANYPITVTDYGVLQHEIFHAADQTLRYMGFKLTNDSDEAYAYLIEYITREVYKKL